MKKWKPSLNGWEETRVHAPAQPQGTSNAELNHAKCSSQHTCTKHTIFLDFCLQNL